jgi:exonuclease III
MTFGSWNVRSLYRAASFTTVGRELARYKLDFVCVQVVRWGKGDIEKAGDYIFIYGKGNENQMLTGFFYTLE